MTTPNRVFRSIQKSSEGLTLAQLLMRHPQLSRRTLQRWLSGWMAEEKISATSQGRARCYRAGEMTLAGQPISFPNYIPLSIEGQDIVAYINQPYQARKPVGYQHDLLSSYRPNVSWYLPESVRQHLHQIGRTTAVHQAAGTYSRAILGRLLIDLSWASSRLEGNTYSLLDTRKLIEQGTRARGKAAIETQMIINHKNAIELLVENVDTARFNRYTLMNLHAALSENLLPNPADEGRVRQHLVDISQSVYRPLSTPQQIDQALDELLTKLNKIKDPFEQSFFAMVHLPYLQPFADVNKRTSRLAANLPLFRANLCPLTFLDVPTQAYSCTVLGVYELTRVELLRDLYVWAYERSAQEYLAIKQELVEPNSARLIYRDIIKHTIQTVVQNPSLSAKPLVRKAVQQVPVADRTQVQAWIQEELQRLHEGVLARYGLRPAQLTAWKRQLGHV